MALTTVAKIKDKLNISKPDYDTIIGSIIDEVDDYIVTFCGQEIEATSETVNFFGSGNTYYLFRNDPINSISSVGYKSTPLDSSVSVSSGDYTLVNEDGIYKLYNDNGFTKDVYYTITFNYGYSTLPEDIVNVATEMAMQKMYEYNTGFSKKDGRFGVSQEVSNFNGTQSTITYLNGMSKDWVYVLMKYRAIV